jgi:flagellar FliL protein
MANRLESPKSVEDNGTAHVAVASAPKAGGKSWMPLALNIVLMPAIAYALTVFVLIPKIQGGKGAPADSEKAAHGAHGSGAKSKITVPLSGKILVNVSGTAGTRYLVANLSLVGKIPDLKAKVDENDPQLRDAAMSILGGKTIGDLEKPGMRNVIRAELISAFNDIVGKEAVTDIYFTEFAIQ